MLDQIERTFAEGVNHFWLDLHWHLVQALGKQEAPMDGWADIVKRDLGMLLDRLPGPVSYTHLTLPTNREV